MMLTVLSNSNFHAIVIDIIAGFVLTRMNARAVQDAAERSASRPEPRHVTRCVSELQPLHIYSHHSFTSITSLNYRFHQSTRATACWVNRFSYNFKRLCVCVLCVLVHSAEIPYRYTWSHLFPETAFINTPDALVRLGI